MSLSRLGKSSGIHCVAERGNLEAIYSNQGPRLEGFALHKAIAAVRGRTLLGPFRLPLDPPTDRPYTMYVLD